MMGRQTSDQSQLFYLFNLDPRGLSDLMISQATCGFHGS